VGLPLLIPQWVLGILPNGIPDTMGDDGTQLGLVLVIINGTRYSTLDSIPIVS